MINLFTDLRHSSRNRGYSYNYLENYKIVLYFYEVNRYNLLLLGRKPSVSFKNAIPKSRIFLRQDYYTGPTGMVDGDSCRYCTALGVQKVYR